MDAPADAERRPAESPVRADELQVELPVAA
jgi:hypothetical protein